METQLKSKFKKRTGKSMLPLRGTVIRTNMEVTPLVESEKEVFQVNVREKIQRISKTPTQVIINHLSYAKRNRMPTSREKKLSSEINNMFSDFGMGV